ncbi:Jerky -like [Amphibalanus amphitrite]|uniref:Jerky-like n=1 Tax=Amphibalanus amphitrite TaxID=1232801 RepID=A0A6A4W569_AMPAM|nr:Jerky -like [Amphibalanus amphitrite]
MVRQFFDIYQGLLGKYQFQSRQVWNMDETGITTVQTPSKILAKRGKRTVGALTSAERGQLITVVAACSAAGHYIPPMLIWPRKRHLDKLMDGTPPGSIAGTSDSGWTDGDLFLKWLIHFQQWTQSSSSNPQLLIMDGHQSHKYIPAILYARENHIHMLTLQPHTSHKMQPLDRTVFKALKAGYNIAVENHMRTSGGKITMFDMGQLIGKAFNRVATPDKAIKGFEVTARAVERALSEKPVPAVERALSEKPVPAVERALSEKPVPAVERALSEKPVAAAEPVLSAEQVPAAEGPLPEEPAPVAERAHSLKPTPAVERALSEK